MSFCKLSDIVNWKSPNGAVFIACCQKCGFVTSSLTDPWEALSVVEEHHQKVRTAETAKKVKSSR